MKPSPPPTPIAECNCGWSSRCRDEYQRRERLRYHRIVVHNDRTEAHGTF